MLQDRREDLTVDLVEKLSIFCGSEDFEWFLDGTYENCILPAAKLNEKIMVSVHEVLPDIRIFTEVNQRGRFVTSPQFFASVTEMDCQNLLRDRKSFSLQKLDKTIQPGELEANLFCVCAVVPGLKLHRAGRGGRDSEPIVLRKQRVLMGWGTKEERRGFRQER